jgi:thiopeptide-type bacteriocin biosynthesis protein
MTVTWLAATLHTSLSRHNTLLVEHLPRLLETLPDGVERWYLDQRIDAVALRFLGASRSLRPHLFDWGLDVLDTGLADRLEIGSYRADFSNYGGPATENAATEFLHADSNAILTQLRLADVGALTLEPTTLALLCRADLTRAWYDRPATPGAEGPPRQMALLAPWWQQRAEVLRGYGALVRCLDPALMSPVLSRLLDRHRLQFG